MTIADLMLIAVSVIFIGGVYLAGRCSRNARRDSSACKEKS